MNLKQALNQSRFLLSKLHYKQLIINEISKLFKIG